jgi:hypothetical protein
MHLDSLHEIAVKIIEVDLAQTMDLQNEITILKVCVHYRFLKSCLLVTRNVCTLIL